MFLQSDLSHFNNQNLLNHKNVTVVVAYFSWNTLRKWNEEYDRMLLPNCRSINYKGNVEYIPAFDLSMWISFGCK